MQPQPVVLREQTVLERTKAESLLEVRNLNLWGEGLTDVSVVEKIPGIEVLALAANQLTTLRPFSTCTSLRELYLRKNYIKSLAEVKYIKGLPKLHTLWLMDNPCAKSPNYRSFVIRCCPHLKQLDDIEVTEREREEAKRKLSKSAVHCILRHGSITEAELNSSPQQLSSPSSAPKVVEKGPTAGVVGRLSKDGKAKEKEETRQGGSRGDDTVRASSVRPTPSGGPCMTLQTQQAILTAIVSLIPELTLESLGVLQKELREEVERKEKATRNQPSGSQ
ncbi:Protein C21orf2 [Trypanosoma conorhini]|uniref:Protein C21orf2 n=1 Tax=Trypanosoma conorhini TaxID=83891 RepID=A0A422NGU2_9TRYP|nr:Protein C21orf2 [Trypanosoma conorhini]RNF04690.1 Protein C21orf2 [Trypanosoma conorhini]